MEDMPWFARLLILFYAPRELWRLPCFFNLSTAVGFRAAIISCQFDRTSAARLTLSESIVVACCARHICQSSQH